MPGMLQVLQHEQRRVVCSLGASQVLVDGEGTLGRVEPCGIRTAAVTCNAARACAAGGTIAKVVGDLVQRGASPAFIRVVAVVAAPPALKLLSEKFPGAPCVGAAGRQKNSFDASLCLNMAREHEQCLWQVWHVLEAGLQAVQQSSPKSALVWHACKESRARHLQRWCKQPEYYKVTIRDVLNSPP